MHRFHRLCAGLALLPLLSGCVAAVVAVPALTATGVLSERKDHPAEPAPRIAPPAIDPSSVESSSLVAVPIPAGGAQLTNLAELPPPSGAPADLAAAPWQAFASFALDRAKALASGGEAKSALLAPGSALDLQARTRDCADREPAVIVDLDPGSQAFAPAATSPAPPMVAATLASLREAGVVILWTSQVQAVQIESVAGALKSSGLDPTGRDPILLVRHEDERKQVLREEANETVCVVAIAGDSRADFDELFDYLRDPTLATTYDALIGAGWFLVPPLTSESVALVVPDITADTPSSAGAD